MRLFALSLPFAFCFACSSVGQSEEMHANESKVEDSIYVNPSQIDTSELSLNFEVMGSYNDIKREIARNRQSANSKEDLERYLLDQIVPHWYGTEWDFNGYTAIPNQGEIACGYFVSTTLLHAGFKLNRYTMAQQAGLYEAQTLAITEDHYETSYGLDSLLAKIEREYKDGLYFVGLDNHVGYVYVKNSVPYFLHSNYIEDRVMIEKAEYSDAFVSNIYVMAEISTNELLLEKWRNGDTISVVTP